jgi:Domain of unknown function (DUF6891)
MRSTDQDEPPEDDGTDLRAEALDALPYYVWSGYLDPDEVFEYILNDLFLDADEEDEAWLRSAVKREFRRKRVAERDWPEVTSCDRLDRAFEALAERNVLARHRAGLTQQDGLAVVESLYEEAGGTASDFTGYCFYTTQDMEHAMEGPGLWLAFGHFSGDPEKGVAVGRAIREVIESYGFPVAWDGTIDSRLFLSDFQWQRRSPGD